MNWKMFTEKNLRPLRYVGLRLWFCAAPEAIQRILRIWKVFDLPVQATAFR